MALLLKGFADDVLIISKFILIQAMLHFNLNYSFLILSRCLTTVLIFPLFMARVFSFVVLNRFCYTKEVLLLLIKMVTFEVMKTIS